MKFKLLLTISVMMCTMCIASEDTAPLDAVLSSTPQASPDLPPDLEELSDLSVISDDVMRHHLLPFVDQETKKSIQNSSKRLKRYISQDKSSFSFVQLPQRDKTEETMVKIFQAFPYLKTVLVDLKVLEAISNVMKREAEYYEWGTHSKILKKDFPFRSVETIYTYEELTERAVEQLEQFERLKHLYVSTEFLALDQKAALRLMNNIIPKLETFHISHGLEGKFYPFQANQQLEIISYEKLLFHAENLKDLGITIDTPFHYHLTILEQFPNLESLTLNCNYDSHVGFEELEQKINWEPLFQLRNLKKFETRFTLPDYVIEEIVKNNPKLEEVTDFNDALSSSILMSAGFKKEYVRPEFFRTNLPVWKRKVRRP